MFSRLTAVVPALLISLHFVLTTASAGVVPLARLAVSFPNDIAYDDKRGELLYTSQEVAPLHSQVHRYNVSSGSMSTPLQGPANARYWGVTVAPDHRYAYAADRFNPRV